MRRLIGFAIRDIWYKLGKQRSVSPLLLLESRGFTFFMDALRCVREETAVF